MARTAQSPDLMWRRVLWIALAGAWLFAAVSALGFDPADPPSPVVTPHNSPVANWCGWGGAVLAYYAFEMFGWGLWVLIALWGLHLAVMAAGGRAGHIAVRLLGAVLMAAAVAGLQALLLPATGPVNGLGGGLIGTVGAAELSERFNTLGTFLILLLVFMLGAVVALDAWAMLAALWAGRAVVAAGRPVGRLALAAAQAATKSAGGGTASKPPRPRVRPNDLDDDRHVPGRGAPGVKVKNGDSRRRKGKEEGTLDETAEGADGAEAVGPDEGDDPHGDAAYDDVSPTDSAGEDDDAPEPSDDREDDDAPGAPQVFDPDALREKIAKLPLRFAAATRRSATEDDLRDLQNVAEMEGYRFPGLDLLEEPEQNYSEKLEAFVREQAASLERALKEYRIDGTVVGIDSGPVITNFEIRLAPGTKVAALSAVASDLARALKAVNIRLVPNTAGRDTVGIEVPNAIKEKVRLKELMTASEVAGGSKMALPMFLGKDASGQPLIEDLAKMPHMLIAGTTGSGKSVCMNTVIMSFLYTKKPNELKLVLVDPKMVEMSQFKDIPHLMCPVVTEMSKAAAILEWAVGKMEERYELLAEAGCRDIAGYNALTWEEIKEAFAPQTPEEEARIPRKLPYMVFVIDELADLMMTNKEVEHSIVRIAQKARAVGIHLIIATQRPQANVVTGLIKSNMPARVTFKVASGMDSRIVLDQKGGELLLGQGDMLYLSPRSHKLMRAQGTLVDDKEIRRVVKFLRDIAAPTFERQLVQIRHGASAGEGPTEQEMRDGFMNAQEDPLFDQAVEIVVETQQGSVSMLQRRLAIGYTRAARLIEMMGEVGILGTHKGTVARDVLMTVEEWRALKAQAAADAAARDQEPDPAAEEPGDGADGVDAADGDGAEDDTESDTDHSEDADDDGLFADDAEEEDVDEPHPRRTASGQ